MAIIACPNCNASIDESVVECSNCGLILAKWRERNAGGSDAKTAPQVDLDALSARPNKNIRSNIELDKIRLPIYAIRLGATLIAVALFLSLPGPWSKKPKPVTTAELASLSLPAEYVEVSDAAINMMQRFYKVFYEGGSFFSSTSPFQRRTPIGPAPADVDSVKIKEVELWISDQQFPCIWYVREAGLTSATSKKFPANYAVQDITPDVEVLAGMHEGEVCEKLAVVRAVNRVGTTNGLLLFMLGGPILTFGLVTRFMQKI